MNEAEFRRRRSIDDALPVVSWAFHRRRGMRGAIGCGPSQVVARAILATIEVSGLHRLMLLAARMRDDGQTAAEAASSIARTVAPVLWGGGG